MKKSLLERIYRSPLGVVLSGAAHFLASFQKPFMVYGMVDPKTKIFRKYTRLSSTAIILNKPALSIENYVWVGHHVILDASGGLEIGEGVQFAAMAEIYTHGSQNSIRLLGKEFVNIHSSERKGYTRGRVKIGAYTFIGVGAVVLPGVEIGKGCLIGTGALVLKNIPDYSVAVGSPAKIIGSTLDIDAKFFAEEDFSATYYDQDALNLILSKKQT